MYRPRRLRGHVAGDASGEGKLPKETFYTFFIRRNIRVDLAVRPFQISIGDKTRAAVAGTGDVDRVEVVFLDGPVHMDVDKVQAGRGSPVAEQARLDVLQLKRLLQERVIEKVDLSDG